MILHEELVGAIAKEISQLKETLANGSASDYTDYMHIVGKIEGLEWSIAHIKDIVNKRFDDEGYDTF